MSLRGCDETPYIIEAGNPAKEKAVIRPRIIVDGHGQLHDKVGGLFIIKLFTWSLFTACCGALGGVDGGQKGARLQMISWEGKVERVALFLYGGIQVRSEKALINKLQGNRRT